MQGNASSLNVLFRSSILDARAIVKGKLDKPVEFGRTLQLVQDDSGVIVHYEMHRGNPSDKTQLVSLVRQTKKILKQAPRATGHRSWLLQCR